MSASTKTRKTVGLTGDLLVSKGTAKAVEVAKAVYGTDRRGRAAATNSMVHDVLNEMERVAGC